VVFQYLENQRSFFPMSGIFVFFVAIIFPMPGKVELDFSNVWKPPAFYVLFRGKN